jgi:hypothetical protein
MPSVTTCPKCGFVQNQASDSCPVCGIVFAKFQPARRESLAAPPPLPGGMQTTPACQVCRGPGPVAHAVFRQNVGALFARFEKRIEGNMCKSCLSQKFWPFTLTTLAVGWLGMISLVIAPIYILMNIVEYAKASSQVRRATV